MNFFDKDNATGKRYNIAGLQLFRKMFSQKRKSEHDNHADWFYG